VFDELYASVISGNEARITLEANSKPDYRAKLEEELAAFHDSEMWRAGAAVRSLRPENWKR
jgi:ketol-acid reductoisomerase